MTDVGVFSAFDVDKTAPDAHPQGISVKAIWDTGAQMTVVSKNVVAQLSLQPIGQMNCQGVNGVAKVNRYIVNVKLPNSVGVSELPVMEGNLNGFDVLIGMDLITLGDFSVTANNGKTVMSFRIPNNGVTDYVHETNRLRLSILKKNPKNGCVCGSGKTAKKCCIPILEKEISKIIVADR
jgi:hypothetical protein